MGKRGGTSNVVRWGTSAAIAASFTAWIVAFATPTYQGDLYARYPGAAAGLPNCIGCHESSQAQGLNPFGADFLANGFTFNAALEALDSDGDGFSNGDELKSDPSSAPGDLASTPGAAPPPPVPNPTDGPGLYAAACAACHAPLASSAKGGASAARINAAIVGNVGGMGYLSSLTPAEVDLIAAALASVAPPAPTTPPAPPPAGVDGTALYASQCASCHGALAASGKAGATAARIQAAIVGNIGGMGYLAALSAAQVDAIATVLANVTAPGASVVPAGPVNHTGLWWNPGESGWGLNVNHQGELVFATLFDYDAAGAPMWVMAGARKQADGRTYSGDLYQMTGSPFDAQPFVPLTAANQHRVGTLSITFVTSSAATLTYTYAGKSVAKNVVPQVFGSGASVCTGTTGDRTALANYQDMWWNPAESGWGVNLVHQDDTVFAVLMTYDAAGEDLWLTGAATRQADGSFTGELVRTRGPAFDAQPFTPVGTNGIARVGGLRLTFRDGMNGTLAYSYNGVTVTKAITRQVFSSPVPACASLAATALAATDGATLYGSHCASCHRPLATSTKGSASLARVQYAIASNAGGMGALGTLSIPQLQAIVDALGPIASTAIAACGSCHPVPPAAGVHPKHDTRFTCSACHGPGYDKTNVATATHMNGLRDLLAGVGWNAATNTCSNACHGIAAWAPGATLGCGTCHGVPPPSGDHAKHDARFTCSQCHGSSYSATTVNAATHNNGTKDIAADIGWNASAGTCSNGCHGPAPWSASGSLSCTSCHGIPPATGDHVKHDARFTCSQCHGSGYSATTVNAATHNNGTKDIAASVGWNATAATCSNGCHGPAPWSASGSLSCTSCHAIPPSSGDHVRHDAYADCGTCHGSGYSSTTVNAATHNNGTKDIAAAIGWNASATTCSNSCHGTGTWSTAATLPCTACHGVPPSTGHHGDHRNRGCDVCHGSGYSTTTTNAATHRNGVKEVIASTGWNAGNRSCSNNCHGKETW